MTVSASESGLKAHFQCLRASKKRCFVRFGPQLQEFAVHRSSRQTLSLDQVWQFLEP